MCKNCITNMELIFPLNPIFVKGFKFQKNKNIAIFCTKFDGGFMDQGGAPHKKSTNKICATKSQLSKTMRNFSVT